MVRDLVPEKGIEPSRAYFQPSEFVCGRLAARKIHGHIGSVEAGRSEVRQITIHRQRSFYQYDLRPFPIAALTHQGTKWCLKLSSRNGPPLNVTWQLLCSKTG